MVTLGISDSHNSSACVIDKNGVVSALSEERITNVKNWMGFPIGSIDACLEVIGLSRDDVGQVGLAGLSKPWPYPDRETIIRTFRSAMPPLKHALFHAKRRAVRAIYQGAVRDAWRSLPHWQARDRRRRLLRMRELIAAGFQAEKIWLVEHHHAHAAAAYYGWGKFAEDVLVLTNDGGGDGLCATVNVGRAGRIQRLAEVHGEESLGLIYGVTTCILGMVPLEHEYKLMGLAPYADERQARRVADDLHNLFQFEPTRGITWLRRPGAPVAYESYPFLRALFELRRFDAIAAGVQKFTEEFVTQWVRNCVASTGIRRVALAGGMFLNVKLNKLIMELPEVDELFVFPSCGDETNAIGAAYDAHFHAAGLEAITPIGPFYLGRQFSNAQVEQALAEHKGKYPITVERPAELEGRVAELLAAGEVVARFSGREEFGARALGNRSILADPARPEVVKVINDAIKARDFWMPFAPSVLAETADEVFRNPKRIPAPYMILSFDSTERHADVAAACHPYDLTVRPQVVTAEFNPRYHRLLTCFRERTGRGALLNTSFNLHGYPIVGSPQEALHVLDVSGLRYLALGECLVHKRGP